VIRHYEPWVDGAPAPGSIVITASGDANCWEGSIVSARADAYRCSTSPTYEGGNLFDPCFASPADGHRMLCPSEPLGSRRLVAMTSSDPGPSNGPGTVNTDLPWEIGLADNVTCRLVSGASVQFQGLRANYFCSDRRWLWGGPDRSQPAWTIHVSRTGQPTHLDKVRIMTVWE
jgi:hypothetical protein